MEVTHGPPCRWKIRVDARRLGRCDAGRDDAGRGRTPTVRGGNQLAVSKVPVMTGSGGAVASVDADATQVGIDILKAGGNAADAAIATAAALGVTEPFSGGHRRRRVPGLLRRPATQGVDDRRPGDRAGHLHRHDLHRRCRQAADVRRRGQNSGLSVGVPGTPALWEKAARQFGTMSLDELLQPAEQLAQSTASSSTPPIAQQTSDNQTRFAKFAETARVFLPGGAAPAVGSTFRNPDMAPGLPDAARGTASTRCTRARWATRSSMPPAGHAPCGGVSVYPGQITSIDLRRYRALTPAATSTEYRGLDIYGMPVPSSGGIAVGESLNLIEAYDRKTGQGLSDVDAGAVPAPLRRGHRHRFRRPQPLDRRRDESADPRTVVAGIRRRAGLPAVRPGQGGHHGRSRSGTPTAGTDDCTLPGGAAPADPEEHGTTNLTVADKWGNVAEYTLTIEADRRLRHHRPRLRVPAEQRADRLQLRPADRRGPGSEPARAG